MNAPSTTPEEKKNRIKSALITLAIILGILAGLALVILRGPIPPPQEMGHEMSLGELDMGGPSETPTSNDAAAQPPSESDVTDDLATQDSEDAPLIQKKDETTSQPTPPTPPVDDKPKERTADPRSLYSGPKGEPDDGSGDGDKPGNEGNPDGSLDGLPGGSGLGSFGQGDFSLGGRNATVKKSVEDRSSKTGKIKVRIKVDRNGKVIKAVAGERGTTLFDNTLWAKAANAAKQWKFTPKSDAPEEQIGYITFTFKVTQ